ncbi:hypothetical protein [Thioalkalivibrio sp. ARh3]|uniref:hypothetical protein n=1 Tax=Thioalkalivibrio sp. ARh3 TaxID=1158148 RepID=UPI000382E2FF|nr:hypothetical protein [Thioalkalivibrio sp. ARh3]
MPTQLNYNSETGQFYAPSQDNQQGYGSSFQDPWNQQAGQAGSGDTAFSISDSARDAIFREQQQQLMSQQAPGSVVERSGVMYANQPSHTPNLLSQRGDARDNMAQVHRSMWEDYQRRFIPAENALMASVGNHGEGLDRVGSAVDQQFANQRAEHMRGLSGFGIGMDADQQASFDRTQAVNHASAKAGALNTARMGMRDRDLAAMAGGLGTLAQQRQNPGQP